MIFLEECVHQALLEEGQVIISPFKELDLTWEQLDRMFRGVYNQARGYISVYDWETNFVSIAGQTKDDYAYVRHITYNAYNEMQRFMPDVPGQYWEFNPYNKTLKSLFATTFSFEVGKYAHIGRLPFALEFNDKITPATTSRFLLPCSPDRDFKVVSDNGLEMVFIREDENQFEFSGTLGNGIINKETLIGDISFAKKANNATLSFTSKYSGILELDLTCELFFKWFKASMLTLIGSMKKQIELEGVGLPFSISGDVLLDRGNELMKEVYSLRETKSHWSNW